MPQGSLLPLQEAAGIKAVINRRTWLIYIARFLLLFFIYHLRNGIKVKLFSISNDRFHNLVFRILGNGFVSNLRTLLITFRTVFSSLKFAFCKEPASSKTSFIFTPVFFSRFLKKLLSILNTHAPSFTPLYLMKVGGKREMY